jgi:hypothetical protein
MIVRAPRLDAVYGAHPEESELDPALALLQVRSLAKERS